LFVPDPRQAEAYYRRVFDMDLVGREAPGEDGLWYALPPDKGWDDAIEAGVELGMVALQRGNIVAALFAGKPQPGQLYLIGLYIPLDAMAGVKERLSGGATVEEDHAGALTCRDPNGFLWQNYASGTEFQSGGESGGRWLAV
jgi:catechol 2,3-dioxygenase-like lactoylglutathione lyase family enzyme